ncbi:MAG: hypothetical protein J6V09_04810 [Clostridia bacterium]|nr:hypothetical protein [Clostridia bacterium]
MKKRILCLVLAVIMIFGSCFALASCGEKECTHVDENNDRKCDLCKERVGKIHKHKDEDENDKCDGCGKDMSSAGDEDEASYPWDSGAPVQLLFQMTDNSASRELPSGCNRYLAGGDKAEDDTLDDMIYDRNTAAYNSTNVYITYEYYPDEDGFGHSSTAERMINDSLSQSSGTRPDMYCNFTYDMGAASVKGAFANLKSTLHNYNGANYFEFDDEDYDETVDNRGYMHDFMTSTTLNQDKMYILASDYFTDLVRAFFIVPVNKAMLESVINTPEATQGDIPMIEEKDNVPGYSISDFYGMVREKKWTYNLVKRYSAAIYQDDKSGNQLKDLNDEKIGFAIGAGGMPGSGAIYTTNVTVIRREVDEYGDWKYTYPEESESLAAVFDAIKDLVQSKGVMVVTHDDAKKNNYGKTNTLGIRKRFCESHILFGDIMMVGALEEPEYQRLKEKHGFGILPVPLYHEIPEDSDENYLTTIHNVGRSGAIAANTKNFAECTAFLNYQSTHSTEILDEYYEVNLQYGVADGSSDTVEILQYIRSNVRSVFDKFYEDIIGYRTKFDNSNSEGTNTGAVVWHGFLSKDTMWEIDIRDKYDELRKAKQIMLDVIRNDYIDNTPA